MKLGHLSVYQMHTCFMTIGTGIVEYVRKTCKGPPLFSPRTCSQTNRSFFLGNDIQKGTIARLKSYRLLGNSNLSPTILYAAHSTSVAKSCFEPANIGIRRYVDGAVGADHLVDEAWNDTLKYLMHGRCT